MMVCITLNNNTIMKQLSGIFFVVLLSLLSCTGTKETVSTTQLKSVKPLLSNAQARVNAEKDVRFLAKDEMRGRDTGSPEIKIAADYIRAEFSAAGLNKVTAQEVPLVMVTPASKAELSFSDLQLVLQEDLLVLGGPSTDVSAALVFAGYGSEEELQELDLKGKIVFTNAGSEEETDPRKYVEQAFEKQKRIAAKGAIGLVELFRSKQVTWKQLYRFLGSGGIQLADGNQPSSVIPLLWLSDPKAEYFKELDAAAGTAAKLTVATGERKLLPGENIYGFLKGTDPVSAPGTLLITAHYDHIGVGRSVNGDSIYNGARDNALGVAALLRAARELSMSPPKRNVVFLAVTAEEKGLLGSEYFAENPIGKLSDFVFILNFDGAGYDDTTAVTINGYGRTDVQVLIDAAIEETNIKAKPDPIPEQQLFKYSDNWNFAKRGIPAINLAPGFTGFSPTLMKYYHQPPDEADAVDFTYVERYTRAAVAAAKALGNLTARPRWKEGDELVPAAEALYKFE